MQRNRRAIRRAASRALLGVWMGMLAVVSLLPSPPGERLVARFPGRDFTAHVIAYAVLACLLVWATAPAVLRRRLVHAGTGSVLFGLAIELVQPLTGRAFECRDVCANVAGILLGLLVAGGCSWGTGE